MTQVLAHQLVFPGCSWRMMAPAACRDWCAVIRKPVSLRTRLVIWPLKETLPLAPLRIPGNRSSSFLPRSSVGRKPWLHSGPDLR